MENSNRNRKRKLKIKQKKIKNNLRESNRYRRQVLIYSIHSQQSLDKKSKEIM